ncbi:MAG: trypsin-like peptidase domain-containing protein [Pelolinea sp.]|nr:trypsin-like peptidase domain-containing protein [Pelolinea sp.]
MRHNFGWKLIGLVMLISALLVSCTPANSGQTTTVPTLENIPKPKLAQSVQGKVFPSDDLLVSLYEQINPGVVAILIYSGDEPVGQGSGFVIDNQGHILTNYHVVENTTNFEVVFSDGYRAVGELVGTDPDSDIAVLKAIVPEEELAPLALGNSSDVKVGQSVVAIGNPYGLSGTMTVGIVSARGRLLDTMRSSTTAVNFSAADLIQTDAAINPGNSGGPLLNLQGEVIGINRAIRTNGEGVGTLSNSGIGFAVPIDIVKRVVPYLIRDGRYDYPYLGITSREEFTLGQLEALAMPPDMHGAYVITVPKGSPAEKAGLLGGTQTTSFDGLLAGGDLIMDINGHAILNFSDFLNYLVTNTSPGDEVDLTVLRDGKGLNLKATLIARPQ